MPTMFYASALFLGLVSSVHAGQVTFPKGVIATGTNGATNPQATLPTTINQNSMARLLSLNSIDDFCLFAPPEPNSKIEDTEQEEVAWCIKPRNNARVIPDGTLTGVSFLRTPFYVQIMGRGDFTKINIQKGNAGGELDPHGAEGTGNPIGGNLTTTIADGNDQPIAEWMEYISSDQFCIRACTWANSTFSAAAMCEHKLDVMGCEFVMPGTYHEPGVFETCDADVAYPPGWYPQPDGSFSVFAQYFTGVYTGGDGQPTSYTVGTTVTPNAPAMTPSSYNCVTTASVGNGLAANLVAAGAQGNAPPPGFTSTPTTGGTAPTGAVDNGSSAVVNSSSSKLSTVTAKSTASAGAGATTPTTATSTASASQSVTGTSSARRVAYGGAGEFVGVAAVSFISALAAIGLLH
ncbi:hypothetical protein MKEN_00175900 [Mycena kentingensis (nom. inval.)]|nr:hypothetical protein MKEN_00175900 [Mycena kentingensis (nom. inval.)]